MSQQLGFFVLWALIAVLFAASMVMLHFFAHLERELEARNLVAARHVSSGVALNVGSSVPDIRLEDLRTGKKRRLSDWWGARHFLLILSPTCLSCREIIAGLESSPAVRSAEPELVVICLGESGACESAFQRVALLPVLSGEGIEIRKLVGAGVPVALDIEEGGVVIESRNPRSLAELVSWISIERPPNRDQELTHDSNADTQRSIQPSQLA